MSHQTEPTTMHPLLRVVLSCYPASWRARYRGELEDTVSSLLAAGTSRGRLTADLAVGAVDAWLNPIPDPERTVMPDPTTRLVRPAAWSLLLFVFAGSAFAKLNEDPAFSAAARSHPVLGWCVDALMVAAIGAAAVMLLAVVPALLAVLREDPARRRRDLATLLVVPLCLLVVLGTIVLVKAFSGPDGPHSAPNVAAFLLLVAVTLAAGGCATIALIRVATRLPEQSDIVLTRRLAILAVGSCVAVAALAVTGWAVGVAVSEPSLLHTDNGLLASPTFVTLAAALVGLLVSAAGFVRSGFAVASSRADAPRRSH